MAHRSLGWIQDASDLHKLKMLCELFVKDSSTFNRLKNETFPLLKFNHKIDSEELFTTYFKAIESGNTTLSYPNLKGKGAGKEGRKQALCSGIAQAIFPAQSKVEYSSPKGGVITITKPYQHDWSTEAFLKLAIAIGLLNYDEEADMCTLSEKGACLAKCLDTKDELEIIGSAMLQYPPMIRILSLLSLSNDAQTKFELGNQLGFIGEDGFTSYSQNIWVAEYSSLDNTEQRKMKSNVEGTSDKYARMICSWGQKLGWITKENKTVSEVFDGETYTAQLTAYRITFKGRNALKLAIGYSRHPRIPRILHFGTLATKTPNADYVCHRRALIINYTNKARSLDEIKAMLKDKGFDEANTGLILNDINGLINIGLDYTHQPNGSYKLNDKITGLKIPSTQVADNLLVTKAKGEILERIPHVSPKYLALIDLSVSGRSESTEFEMLTSDLFINELQYKGAHLGGSRRPDNIIYEAADGAIIDNKAYSKGFELTRKQKDEMLRYIDENVKRREVVQNKWWEAFPNNVKNFCFVFVSSFFKGDISFNLNDLAKSTGVNGVGLTAEMMLYLAEEIKTNRRSKAEIMQTFFLNKVLLPEDINVNHNLLIPTTA